MKEKPLFLLSNDDGVHAPGLMALTEAVAPFGDVVVVAPHIERSGNSSMLSIHTPLRSERLSENVYAVEGSPVDCIVLALRHILDRLPTWVVSGINRGGNLGQDTLYSGTVGAALEGCLHGIRSIAVSSHGQGTMRYDTAAKVVNWLLKQEEVLRGFGGVINVNVPNMDFEDLKGVRVTEEGRRLYDQSMDELFDPRGRPYFWVGGGGDTWEDIPNSDCVAVSEGYVSISALTPSLFDPQGNDTLRRCLSPTLHQS